MGASTFAGLCVLKVLLLIAHATSDISYSAAVQFGDDKEAESAIESALRTLTGRQQEFGAMARDLQHRRTTAEAHDDLLEQHTKSVLLPFVQSLLERVIRQHGLWREAGDTDTHNLFVFVQALEKHRQTSRAVDAGLRVMHDLITTGADGHKEL